MIKKIEEQEIMRDGQSCPLQNVPLSLETEACCKYNSEEVPILNDLKMLLKLRILRSFSLKDIKYAYERFDEEQKIAFLLAGEAAQFLHNWQEAREQSQKRVVHNSKVERVST